MASYDDHISEPMLPKVMSVLEASGRRIGPLDESMFQDMFS